MRCVCGNVLCVCFVFCFLLKALEPVDNALLDKVAGLEQQLQEIAKQLETQRRECPRRIARIIEQMSHTHEHADEKSSHNHTGGRFFFLFVVLCYELCFFVRIVLCCVVLLCVVLRCFALCCVVLCCSSTRTTTANTTAFGAGVDAIGADPPRNRGTTEAVSDQAA